MNSIKLTVKGIVKGQPRVKSRAFKSKSGKVISSVYTPKTADAWKALVMQEALQNAPECPYSGPIKIFIVVVMPRPKSHYRTGKFSHLLKKNVPYYYTNTPDNDNIEKGIWDAISDTKVIWNDDRQIYSNSLEAYYGDEPGASIIIREITP